VRFCFSSTDCLSTLFFRGWRGHVLPLLPRNSLIPQQQPLLGVEGEAEVVPEAEAGAELSPEQHFQ
ncbi:hypothetical protein, partial [Enterobacter hormaechei]|uniref:hypothetical protein n=1 Tax=Enterobacter hormaechei TaxID=158836 RepID=UPI0029DA41AE